MPRPTQAMPGRPKTSPSRQGSQRQDVWEAPVCSAQPQPPTHVRGCQRRTATGCREATEVGGAGRSQRGGMNPGRQTQRWGAWHWPPFRQGGRQTAAEEGHSLAPATLLPAASLNLAPSPPTAGSRQGGQHHPLSHCNHRCSCLPALPWPASPEKESPASSQPGDGQVLPPADQKGPCKTFFFSFWVF